MERNSRQRNAPAASVERVTAVLDAFVKAERDLGVTEVANRVGLAKSVVHRLVTALARSGYLAHDPVSRRYALGPSAVRLGHVALGQTSIRERARPLLRELALETGETATLSVLVGDHRVYAEQVESTQSVRQSVLLGQEAPLFVGASGKAMLAFLPPPRRAAILRAVESRHTARADGTPVDVRALARELEVVRLQGFATSRSERVLGAASAAAPVFDHRGHVAASISVAGVTVRHGEAELHQFGQQARRYAERLSRALGWAGPTDAAAS